MSWTRGSTPTGAPVHALDGTPYRAVAVMSRSRVVGQRLVFGQVVSECDHRARPTAWDLYRGEQLIALGVPTLVEAKRRLEARG